MINEAISEHEDEEESAKLRDMAARLSCDTEERHLIIRIPSYFSDKIINQLPAPLQDVGYHVQAALEILVGAYWTLEKDIETNRLQIPYIVYHAFHQLFSSISDILLQIQDILAYDGA